MPACYKSQIQGEFPCCKMVAKGVTALCLLVINHRYKEATPPQYAPICRSRGLCGNVSRRVLYCCHTAAARETERRANGERWVSLPPHDFFFHQFERKSVNIFTPAKSGRRQSGRTAPSPRRRRCSRAGTPGNAPPPAVRGTRPAKARSVRPCRARRAPRALP